MKKLLSTALAAALLTSSAYAWVQNLPLSSFLATPAEITSGNTVLANSTTLYPETNTIVLEVVKKGITWNDVFSAKKYSFKNAAIKFTPYGQDRTPVKEYEVLVYPSEGGTPLKGEQAIKSGQYVLQISAIGYNPVSIWCNAIVPEQGNMGKFENPALHTLTVMIPASTKAGTVLKVFSKADQKELHSITLTQEQILRVQLTIDLGGYQTTEVDYKFLYS